MGRLFSEMSARPHGGKNDDSCDNGDDKGVN